jgi:hypothetical protein
VVNHWLPWVQVPPTGQSRLFPGRLRRAGGGVAVDLLDAGSEFVGAAVEAAGIGRVEGVLRDTVDIGLEGPALGLGRVVDLGILHRGHRLGVERQHALALRAGDVVARGGRGDGAIDRSADGQGARSDAEEKFAARRAVGFRHEFPSLR